MIPENAPCDLCDRPHTKRFCNDGFHTEGSDWLCARCLVEYNNTEEWTYEQAVITVEEHEPEDPAEV